MYLDFELINSILDTLPIVAWTDYFTVVGLLLCFVCKLTLTCAFSNEDIDENKPVDRFLNLTADKREIIKNDEKNDVNNCTYNNFLIDCTGINVKIMTSFTV